MSAEVTSPAVAPAAAVPPPASAVPAAAPVAVPDAAPVIAPPAKVEPAPVAERKPVRWAAPRPAPAAVDAVPAVAPVAPAAEPPAVLDPSAPKQVRDAARLQAEAEIKSLRGALSTYAASALASLPSDSARAAVAKLAGDNPARQLEAIETLRASGLLPSVMPLGATTAPSPNAQPAPQASEDPDVIVAREFEKLSSSPMRAAAYRLQHGAAIARGLQKLAK